MGTGTSTLPREELLILFDQVDTDKSGTLDHGEVQALCQLIWEKEKQSGKIPKKVGNSVFALLDNDGDGIITHDEFELLVEEVYNDRSHIIEDAGVKLDTGSSWLGFLGISQGSKDDDDEEAAPAATNDIDPDAIIEAVQPTRTEAKPRKVRAKKEESEESDHKSEKSDRKSESEPSSKSSSESESVAEPAPRKSKRKKPKTPPSEAEEAAPAPLKNEAPPEPESSSWFSNLFSGSTGQKGPTAEKAVDQESRSFWQSWTEPKPEAAPATLPAATRQVPDWPATNGPGVTLPPRLLPLNEFLSMLPQQSTQRQAIEIALQEEDLPRYVRIRPWPSDYSPAWESYQPFRMRR